MNEYGLRVLRENAAIRQEAIQRGLATPGEMDARGFLSGEDLRVVEEHGLLEVAAEEAATGDVSGFASLLLVG